jgi:type II secretory pathway pseudopilin PulG
MPEREHRRANLMAQRLFVMMIIACLAMVIAVIVLESNLRKSEQQARNKQTQQLRAGCARGVQRDEESWGTNHDLAGFARDAGKARRVSGDLKIAKKYVVREHAAEARMASIKRRLPDHGDQKSITQFCLKLYPNPAP